MDNDTTGGGNPFSQFGRQGIEQVAFGAVAADDEFALFAESCLQILVVARICIMIDRDGD